MAAAPENQDRTIVYPGGTATGIGGLIDYLFGEVELAWAATNPGPNVPGQPKKRKYASKQASNAAAGEPIRLRLDTGDLYTLRVTGTHTAFIDQLILSGASVKVEQVFSERGTKYGKRPIFTTP